MDLVPLAMACRFLVTTRPPAFIGILVYAVAGPLQALDTSARGSVAPLRNSARLEATGTQQNGL